MPAVSVMLTSIEPDIEDPFTVTINNEEYSLRLSSLLGGWEFDQGFLSELDNGGEILGEILEAKCQYHVASSFEIEAINSME